MYCKIASNLCDLPQYVRREFMPLGPKTKAFFEKLKEDAKNQPIKPFAQLSIGEFRKACSEGFNQYATN